MKKKIKITVILSVIITLFTYTSCNPIREFARIQDYPENINYQNSKIKHDFDKKTVVIIADSKTTEIFDLIAPYYLFSSTEKANVYIISENKTPIYLYKGLFVLPHLSFKEFDKLNIKSDAIIVPNLSGMKPKEQNPVVLEWIKNNYNQSTNILSVCAGASTLAATGIYDEVPLTTHASDYENIKGHYPNPKWVTGVSVTNVGNLYSTAGVSNAVEGSLLLIKNMFGTETMQNILNIINYPHPVPKIKHNGKKITFSKKLGILKKVMFGKNKSIGVLLENGIDEFKLASILDTYNRTFPTSINSFSFKNKTIKSKYNLTIIPMQRIEKIKVDEIHVPYSLSNSKTLLNNFTGSEIIFYKDNSEYIFNKCLNRIEEQHGLKFKNITKLLLDYN